MLPVCLELVILAVIVLSYLCCRSERSAAK